MSESTNQTTDPLIDEIERRLAAKQTAHDAFEVNGAVVLIRERDDEIKRLRDALEAINKLGGLTLVCASYAPGDDAAQAYSLGANRAFAQAANIARSALEGESNPCDCRYERWLTQIDVGSEQRSEG